jgi:hypothetical protein
MLYDVIIMFCIDLWVFSIDPPYFGYNSAEIGIELFSARFFIFFNDSYGPAKLTEVASFHPLHS